MSEKLENEDEIMFTERKRWLFLGLPFTFTKYTITPSLLTIDQGLFNTVEDDCYMYKIQDVKLNTSLLERIFKLGTIIFYTGDITDSELKQSEVARIKRRTLNTVDIGAHNIDLDDIAD